MSTRFSEVCSKASCPASAATFPPTWPAQASHGDLPAGREPNPPPPSPKIRPYMRYAAPELISPVAPALVQRAASDISGTSLRRSEFFW